MLVIVAETLEEAKLDLQKMGEVINEGGCIGFGGNSSEKFMQASETFMKVLNGEYLQSKLTFIEQEVLDLIHDVQNERIELLDAMYAFRELLNYITGK